MRVTEEEYENLKKKMAGKRPPPKKSKYRNVPTTVDGIRFASKAEASFYERLKLMRDQTGEVRWFTMQTAFPLAGGITYRADFLVMMATGEVRVIDVKGMETQEFKLKKKLFEERYPLKLEVIK